MAVFVTSAFQMVSRWDIAVQQIRSGVIVGLQLAADKMADEIRGELYQPKSGRMYGTHRASAPGESPASDTKRFEESITTDFESEFVIAIAPTVRTYPLVLEFGGAKMSPRPVWAPVGTRLGGNDGQVAQIIHNEIQKRLTS